MSEVHADNPHVAAALAEFRLVLVAMQRKLKAFRLQAEKRLTKPLHHFGRSLLRIRNHQHAERRSDQALEVLENRGYLLEVPDAEIMKAEEEFASHALKIVILDERTDLRSYRRKTKEE